MDNIKFNIINDYKNGINISTLERNYKKSRKTLRKILYNEKVIDSITPKRKKYFVGTKNVHVRNNLIERYNNEKDLNKLSVEFNIPKMSIYNFLKKEKLYDVKFGRELHNNNVRKYLLNENFFNSIDSEEKAYFLGILYADGTNSLKKNEISLRLIEDDSNILEKLNNLLQPTKPLGLIKKRNDNHKNMYRLIINSKKISEKLNKYGLIPNKTYSLTFPNWLNKKLYKDFIRGYFDGDGSIMYNKKNKQLHFSFTGTEEMMLSIQKILINDIGLSKTKLMTRHPERNNNIKTLEYFGNGNARKFYHYIYDNSTIFIERKINKFNKHMI